MANKSILILLILSLVINDTFCQTFQYSHGWTNGKRAVAEFPGLTEISNPSNDGFTNAELKRLKMLVRGLADEQPLLIHCDFLDNLKKIVHMDNFGPQLRREKTQDDGRLNRSRRSLVGTRHGGFCLSTEDGVKPCRIETPAESMDYPYGQLISHCNTAFGLADPISDVSDKNRFSEITD